MTALKYWLWLTSRSELTPDGMHRVLRHFGTPEAAYYADDTEYDRLSFLRPVAKASLRDKSMEQPERILSDCDSLGVRIYTLQDTDYPDRLRHIPQPPLVLYCRGKAIHFDDEVAIAIAGTRNCSDYGRKMATKLAGEITRHGGLVVTGVVAGCDYAAATAALKAGGPVVCVLAGGVDVPFDEYSRDLYRRVLENGTLISELPPGREPVGRNFPQRNRILTGLCLGTLCVEGSTSSGVMLVAKHALDQNRDIFVVPTGADRPEGSGVLALLKDGATPVTAGTEILETYAIRFPQRLRPHMVTAAEKSEPARKEQPALQPIPAATSAPAEDADEPNPEAPAAPMEVIDLAAHRDEYTDYEAAFLRSLQNGERTAEELLAETEIPAKYGLSTLTLLTLRGLIVETDGARFRALVKVK